MAYAKLNETGFEVRKGLLKIRVDFYLDPGDYGYAEHHIVDPDKPHKAHDNPFVCCFEYIDPDITDDELQSIINLRLTELVGVRSSDGDISRYWASKRHKRVTHVHGKESKCVIKAFDIAKRKKRWER